MRKLITVLAIGAVLASGTAVASAHWGGSGRWGGVNSERVTEKLDQLVEEGVITSDQAEQAGTLFEAVQALREERQAEREALKEQLESFLEDDLLTAAELAQLPEDHPFRDPEGKYAEYLQDGQITAEELEEIKANRWRWGRWGHRHWVKEQLEEFLEDDVITAEELAQLPEDHPFRDTDGKYTEYLEDGQITAEELEEIKAEHSHWGHRGKRGHRGWFGGFGKFGGDETESSRTNTNARILIPNRYTA